MQVKVCDLYYKTGINCLLEYPGLTSFPWGIHLHRSLADSFSLAQQAWVWECTVRAKELCPLRWERQCVTWLTGEDLEDKATDPLPLRPVVKKYLFCSLFLLVFLGHVQWLCQTLS